MPTARRFVLHAGSSQPRILGIDDAEMLDRFFTVATLKDLTEAEAVTLVYTLNRALAYADDSTVVQAGRNKALAGLPETVATAIEQATPPLFSVAMFDALFVPSKEGQEEGEDFDPSDTPRTMHALWWALEVLRDQASEAAEEYENKDIDDQAAFWSDLPQCTWRLRNSWREGFLQGFDGLIADLEHGHRPAPNTTAEEMILWLAIDHAKTAHTDEWLGDDSFLAEHPGDYDWDWCRDVLYQDLDFLGLWNTIPGQDPLRIDPFPDVLDPFWPERSLHRRNYRTKRATAEEEWILLGKDKDQ